MKLTKKLIENFVEWDTVNWGKALLFFQNKIDAYDFTSPVKCLELGGRNGGISLFLAYHGFEVICSDFENPEELAKVKHQSLNYSGKIEYQAIDGTKIPYENEFDIIILKSIIGGISRNKADHLQKEIFDQIFKALKPGGILLFAENLEASPFHKWARKKFINWGDYWNYLKINNLPLLLEKFDSVEYETTGFLGTFGRNENQRKILGTMDQVFNEIIPENYRYILYCFAQKPVK